MYIATAIQFQFRTFFFGLSLLFTLCSTFSFQNDFRSSTGSPILKAGPSGFFFSILNSHSQAGFHIDRLVLLIKKIFFSVAAYVLDVLEKQLFRFPPSFNQANNNSLFQRATN